MRSELDSEALGSLPPSEFARFTTVITSLRLSLHHEHAGGGELGAQARAAGVPTPGGGASTVGLLGDRTRLFKTASIVV
jgi:hypothetical protein